MSNSQGQCVGRCETTAPASTPRQQESPPPLYPRSRALVMPAHSRSALLPPLRKTIKRKYMPHHVMVHRCVPIGRQAMASSCQCSLQALASSRDGVRAGVDLAGLTVRAGVGLAGQTVRRGLGVRRAATRDASGEVRLASADAAAEGAHKAIGAARRGREQTSGGGTVASSSSRKASGSSASSLPGCLGGTDPADAPPTP